MHAILGQIDIRWEDAAGNCRRVESLLRESPPPPGSLVVLPELFSTGFTMDAARACEPHGGATETRLRGLAAEHRCTLVAGLAVRENDGTARNEAVAVTADGVVARYVKQRPFSLAGEAACYAAGQDPVLFDCGGFRTALFVCYDLRFPELFRAAVARGAELFVVIANWPVKRIHHWVTLLQARAIENQACVIGVNRVGRDPDFSYNGRSLAVDPHGFIVADAAEREGLVTTTLDPAWVRDWRGRFPALRDAGFASGG